MTIENHLVYHGNKVQKNIRTSSVPVFAFDGQTRVAIHSCGGTMVDCVESGGSHVEKVPCTHKRFGHDFVTYKQFITYRECTNCGQKMQIGSETKATSVECHGYY